MVISVDSMEKTTTWWHHAAVMAAYAGTYTILREASFTHWVLTAGLRVTCLMFVPPRFWPALIAGETLAMSVQLHSIYVRYGLVFALLCSISHYFIYIPVVTFVRRKLSFLDVHGNIHIFPVLISALLCAVLGATMTRLSITTVVMADGSQGMPLLLSSWLESILGYYLGILTITPCFIAVRDRISLVRDPFTWKNIRQGSLRRDIIFFELPIVVAMLLGSMYIGGDSLPYFRALMLLPVVVLSLRHGWHGAAIGGMLASLPLTITKIDFRDPSVIPAQALLALAISTWLLWAFRKTPGIQPPMPPAPQTGITFFLNPLRLFSSNAILGRIDPSRHRNK